MLARLSAVLARLSWRVRLPSCPAVLARLSWRLSWRMLARLSAHARRTAVGRP
jgi:hypothetical protein